MSATQLVLPLATVPATALRAGVQSLQVVHRSGLLFPGNDPRAPRPCVISNPMAFTLCPILKSVQVQELQFFDEEHCSAILDLKVAPQVHPNQGIMLSLYEWSTQHPASYLIQVASLPQENDSLTVPIQGIKPGEYLVRLIVDGAESPLDVDENPDSPTFQWYHRPRVCLTPS